MKTIHKYEISDAVSQVIEMPKNAEILHVGVQDGNIYLWALVDPEAEKRGRTIAVVGTGWNVSSLEASKHLGTVVVPPFVWHVFEDEFYA